MRPYAQGSQAKPAKSHNETSFGNAVDNDCPHLPLLATPSSPPLLLTLPLRCFVLRWLWQLLTGSISI